MNKIFPVVALTVGFSSGVQAQSTNVTLYGVIDTGLGYTQFRDKNSGALSNKATRTGLINGVQNSTNWGLLGSEDLGDGLQVGFTLEGDFDLLDGTMADGRLFSSTAIVALSGDSWGTLAFGRAFNVADSFMDGVATPQGDFFGEAHAGSTFTSISAVADNLIKYTSPEFSGFQFGLGYSFHVNAEQPWHVQGRTDGDQKLLTMGLRYRNGPMALAASYDRYDGATGGPNVTPPTPYVRDAKSIKSWILAASYDFDVMKLHLAFGQDRNGTMASRESHDSALPRALRNQGGFTYEDGYKTNNYSVGVTIPASGGDMRLNWQSARLGSGVYRDDAATEKNSQNIYSAIYTYPLSKRTGIYALATYGTGYAFSNVTVTQAIIGLQHKY